MKNLTLFMLIFLSYTCLGQTFSKLLDPLGKRYNYPNDIAVYGNSIYLSSFQGSDGKDNFSNSQGWKFSSLNHPIPKFSSILDLNNATNQLIHTLKGNLVSPLNKWHESFYSSYGEVSNYRYTFEKDSIFTNKNWYVELLQSKEESGDIWERTGKYFRKSGSKIYQIVNGTDYTLYDFSLIEGDSFKILPIIGLPESNLIVTKTDSVTLLNNTKRKRIFLRCEDDLDESLYGARIWIEGMGDTHGLI
ncbi:MAG: hypothetical protein LC107_08350 [Chitinophagales bacterium]|nr:hypothetical protein [Chitinophagales bacterium]